MTTATYSHTAQAIAVASATGWNLDTFADENGWSGVGIGPVGQSRDSDALERSNFRVVYPDLVARFGDSVTDVRFGHWAVGWVEEIAYDTGNADVVAAVEATRAALEDYPVVDEMDYSQLEWEDHEACGPCDGCDLCAD